MHEQDRYVDLFEREYQDAKDEFLRLTQLFKDVCWYNFETVCRSWEAPWRKSVPSSTVELLGYNVTRWWNNGHMRERCRCPTWYYGEVRHAPKLPPLIVLTELLAAKEYMFACEQQISAPYDWAPGGKRYEALKQTTLVGKLI
jgi:hypothetical protein